LIHEAETKGKAIHEGWRIRKNGSRFWGSIVITALHGSDGSVIGFSKVTRDLTERKNAEDQLNRYVSELEARNEELEQFTYIASHDLQEPLRKIQTFTDVIENNFHDEEIVKRYFKKINNSSQRMSDLIRSVLNYSRLARSENDRHETDLNEVLNSIFEDLELTISEKHARINAEKLPVINADAMQMWQLFFNLVANAIKFTERDPVVNITYRKVDKSAIDFENEQPDAKVYHEIAIADNGIGFDQQYERVIFNMFQRLHNKHEYSGTGIGLALCRKIIENHNGFIQAKSEPGKGATFYIYLPVAE
jgi:signal transduction histidine kinase